MSNEDLVEEILVEAYELGISDEVFEKVNKYILKYERSQAYKIALEEVKTETQNIKNDE